MTLWRTALTLLLFALWLPVTAHCGLEAVGVFPMDGCCKEEAQGTHHCESGCGIVEDSGLKTECTTVLLPPSFALEVVLQVSPVPISVNLRESATFASDHLPQFVIQTALPIRGPSVAS